MGNTGGSHLSSLPIRLQLQRKNFLFVDFSLIIIHTVVSLVCFPGPGSDGRGVIVCRSLISGILCPSVSVWPGLGTRNVRLAGPGWPVQPCVSVSGPGDLGLNTHTTVQRQPGPAPSHNGQQIAPLNPPLALRIPSPGIKAPCPLALRPLAPLRPMMTRTTANIRHILP